MLAMILKWCPSQRVRCATPITARQEGGAALFVVVKRYFQGAATPAPAAGAVGVLQQRRNSILLAARAGEHGAGRVGDVLGQRRQAALSQEPAYAVGSSALSDGTAHSEGKEPRAVEQAATRGSKGGRGAGGAGEAQEEELALVCPPPALEHDWHPPLAWRWQELARSQVRRPPAGESMCVWDALEVDLALLLASGGLESRVYVFVCEHDATPSSRSAGGDAESTGHGGDKSAESSDQNGQPGGKSTGKNLANAAACQGGVAGDALERGVRVVADVCVRARELLQVGCIGLQARGARLGVLFQATGLVPRAVAVDSEPLKPLLVVRRSDAKGDRLVRASHGRFVKAPPPAVGAGARWAAEHRASAAGGEDSDDEREQRLAGVHPAMDAAGGVGGGHGGGRGLEGVEGWWEWEPFSLAVEDGVSTTGLVPQAGVEKVSAPSDAAAVERQWAARPCTLGALSGVPNPQERLGERGAMWQVEVWDMDAGGQHRLLGACELLFSEVYEHLEKLREAEVARVSAAAERAEQVAALKAAGQWQEGAGQRKFPPNFPYGGMFPAPIAGDEETEAQAVRVEPLVLDLTLKDEKDGGQMDTGRLLVAHAHATNPSEWHPPKMRERLRDEAQLVVRRVRVLPPPAPEAQPPPYLFFAGETEEVEAEEDEVAADGEGVAGGEASGELGRLQREVRLLGRVRASEAERAIWQEKCLLHVLGLACAGEAGAGAGVVSVGVADPCRLVRLEAVRALVALGGGGGGVWREGGGEETVVQALRAAARDADSEVRRTAVEGCARLAPVGDEGVVELLRSVIDDGMADEYLRATAVSRSRNAVGEVQLAAVTALAAHATQGRVRLRTTPPEACGARLHASMQVERSNAAMLHTLQQLLEADIQSLCKPNKPVPAAANSLLQVTVCINPESSSSDLNIESTLHHPCITPSNLHQPSVVANIISIAINLY